MGFPAAWSIQMRETTEQLIMFLTAVNTRALQLKEDWSPSCFIIDCAYAEFNAIRAVFPGVPIIFCSWHVRRYDLMWIARHNIAIRLQLSGVQDVQSTVHCITHDCILTHFPQGMEREPYKKGEESKEYSGDEWWLGRPDVQQKR